MPLKLLLYSVFRFQFKFQLREEMSWAVMVKLFVVYQNTESNNKKKHAPKYWDVSHKNWQALMHSGLVCQKTEIFFLGNQLTTAKNQLCSLKSKWMAKVTTKKGFFNFSNMFFDQKLSVHAVPGPRRWHKQTDIATYRLNRPLGLDLGADSVKRIGKVLKPFLRLGVCMQLSARQCKGWNYQL